MTFSILFWNIWLNNQIRGAEHAGKLLGELQHLTDTYNPDFIGLNEVLQHTKADAPFVSDFLRDTCGYEHSFYAPASPYTDEWLIGAGLYAKTKLSSVAAITISNDTPAARRGYPGQELKAIVATQTTPHKPAIHIIIAHPMHLRFHTLHDHYEGTAALEKLIHSEPYTANTILGGDFNEPGFMPRSFRQKAERTMHFRTGTKRNPTWRHNAWRFTPVRANLDQLYWSKNGNITLQSFEIVKTNVSDHQPLVATFTLV